MHRRQFLTLLATVAIAPRMVAGREVETEPTPPPDTRAPSWEGIRYRSSTAEAEIRSLEVRVSMWDDSTVAGAVAGSLTANAHTPLPEGEFYHSEVTDWTPEFEVAADAVTGREWNTVVGVAAFETCFIQIVVWQGRKLTVVLVSGASMETVRMEALRQMQRMLAQIPVPCGPIANFLPGPDDVPEGMELDWHGSSADTGVLAGPGDRAAWRECTQLPPSG